MEEDKAIRDDTQFKPFISPSMIYEKRLSPHQQLKALLGNECFVDMTAFSDVKDNLFQPDFNIDDNQSKFKEPNMNEGGQGGKTVNIQESINVFNSLPSPTDSSTTNKNTISVYYVSNKENKVLAHLHGVKPNTTFREIIKNLSVKNEFESKEDQEPQVSEETKPESNSIKAIDQTKPEESKDDVDDLDYLEEYEDLASMLPSPLDKVEIDDEKENIFLNFKDPFALLKDKKTGEEKTFSLAGVETQKIVNDVKLGKYTEILFNGSDYEFVKVASSPKNSTEKDAKKRIEDLSFKKHLSMVEFNLEAALTDVGVVDDRVMIAGRYPVRYSRNSISLPESRVDTLNFIPVENEERLYSALDKIEMSFFIKGMNYKKTGKLLQDESKKFKLKTPKSNVKVKTPKHTMQFRCCDYVKYQSQTLKECPKDMINIEKVLKHVIKILKNENPNLRKLVTDNNILTDVENPVFKELCRSEGGLHFRKRLTNYYDSGDPQSKHNDLVDYRLMAGWIPKSAERLAKAVSNLYLTEYIQNLIIDEEKSVIGSTTNNTKEKDSTNNTKEKDSRLPNKDTIVSRNSKKQAQTIAFLNGDIELTTFCLWSLTTSDLISFKLTKKKRLEVFKKFMQFFNFFLDDLTIFDEDLKIKIDQYLRALMSNMRLCDKTVSHPQDRITKEFAFSIKVYTDNILKIIKKAFGTNPQTVEEVKSVWFDMLKECEIHHHQAPHTLKVAVELKNRLRESFEYIPMFVRDGNALYMRYVNSKSVTNLLMPTKLIQSVSEMSKTLENSVNTAFFRCSDYIISRLLNEGSLDGVSPSINCIKLINIWKDMSMYVSYMNGRIPLYSFVDDMMLNTFITHVNCKLLEFKLINGDVTKTCRRITARGFTHNAIRMIFQMIFSFINYSIFPIVLAKANYENESQSLYNSKSEDTADEGTERNHNENMEHDELNADKVYETRKDNVTYDEKENGEPAKRSAELDRVYAEHLRNLLGCKKINPMLFSKTTLEKEKTRAFRHCQLVKRRQTETGGRLYVKKMNWIGLVEDSLEENLQMAFQKSSANYCWNLINNKWRTSDLLEERYDSDDDDNDYIGESLINNRDGIDISKKIWTDYLNRDEVAEYLLHDSDNIDTYFDGLYDMREDFRYDFVSEEDCPIWAGESEYLQNYEPVLHCFSEAQKIIESIEVNRPSNKRRQNETKKKVVKVKSLESKKKNKESNQKERLNKEPLAILGKKPLQNIQQPSRYLEEKRKKNHVRNIEPDAIHSKKKIKKKGQDKGKSEKTKSKGCKEEVMKTSFERDDHGPLAKKKKAENIEPESGPPGKGRNTKLEFENLSSEKLDITKIKKKLKTLDENGLSKLEHVLLYYDKPKICKFCKKNAQRNSVRVGPSFYVPACIYCIYQMNICSDLGNKNELRKIIWTRFNRRSTLPLLFKLNWSKGVTGGGQRIFIPDSEWTESKYGRPWAVRADGTAVNQILKDERWWRGEEDSISRQDEVQEVIATVNNLEHPTVHSKLNLTSIPESVHDHPHKHICNRILEDEPLWQGEEEKENSISSQDETQEVIAAVNYLEEQERLTVDSKLNLTSIPESVHLYPHKHVSNRTLEDEPGWQCEEEEKNSILREDRVTKVVVVGNHLEEQEHVHNQILLNEPSWHGNDDSILRQNEVQEVIAALSSLEEQERVAVSSKLNLTLKNGIDIKGRFDAINSVISMPEPVHKHSSKHIHNEIMGDELWRQGEDVDSILRKNEMQEIIAALNHMEEKELLAVDSKSNLTFTNEIDINYFFEASNYVNSIGGSKFNDDPHKDIFEESPQSRQRLTTSMPSISDVTSKDNVETKPDEEDDLLVVTNTEEDINFIHNIQQSILKESPSSTPFALNYESAKQIKFSSSNIIISSPSISKPCSPFTNSNSVKNRRDKRRNDSEIDVIQAKIDQNLSKEEQHHYYSPYHNNDKDWGHSKEAPYKGQDYLGHFKRQKRK